MPHSDPPCLRPLFPVATGTAMQATKGKYQKCAQASFLVMTLPEGVSSMELSKSLGPTQKSAWFLTQRLREAMTGTGEPDSESPVM